MKFPRREHYESLVESISEKVSQVNRTCFYLYGSFTREADFVPGRSDIDGGFILDSEFLTSKLDLVFLARHLDDCLVKTEEEAGLSPSDPGISVNLNLMDRGINRDGRFLAYDDTYTDYLKTNARIVTGPNFLAEMNGMNYKRESLRSAAYNLRKVRNGLLTYFLDLRKNPQRARKNILSSMNVLWGMPKKILESLGKEIDFGGESFFQTFKGIFPDYDSTFYEKISQIRKNPRGYFGIFENHDSALALNLDSLTATEEMIKGYVERFPYVSQLEVRTLD